MATLKSGYPKVLKSYAAWAGRSLCLFLIVVVFASCASSAPERSSKPEIFATWEGGELSLKDFIEKYDPREVALKSGGDHLDAQVCRAAFDEIYGDVSANASLWNDQELMLQMRQWREGKLIGMYFDALMPAEITDPKDEAVRAYFDEHRREFDVAGNVDVGVLFVACSEDVDERDQGFARMQVLEDRVRVVESPGRAELEPVILEQREISGSANGFFQNLRFDRLAPEVQEAVRTTPVGSFSEIVETPIGLFWFYIIDRQDGLSLSFEQAATKIRSILRSEGEAGWKAKEFERLRHMTGGRGELEVFSRAAKAEGLAADPVFRAEEQLYRRQRMQELAFARDAGMVPSDAEFEAQIDGNPEAFANLLVYWLDILVVEPQQESYAAQKIANEISRRLGAGGVIDAASIAGTMPGVAAYDLGPLSLTEMRVINPSIERVATLVKPGRWKGPIVLNNPNIVLVIVGGVEEITLPQLKEGLAFFVVKRREFPAISELKPRLINNFRQSLLRDSERCLDAFHKRWGFEIRDEFIILNFEFLIADCAELQK